MTPSNRQPCRACDQAAAVGAAVLVPGATMRGVARAFAIPKSTLERHLKEHVRLEPEKPMTARERAAPAIGAIAAASAGPTRYESAQLAVKALAAAAPSSSSDLDAGPPADCPICSSSSHHAIGVGVRQGAAYAAIASRHGVDVDELRRHALGCIPHLLAQAGDLAARTSASVVLGKSSGTAGDAEVLLDQAQALVRDSATSPDPRKRAAAIVAAKGVLELVAKLRGELGADVEGNLTAAPQWARAKTLIISALSPYPEALAAVGEALAAAEAR